MRAPQLRALRGLTLTSLLAISSTTLMAQSHAQAWGTSSAPTAGHPASTKITLGHIKPGVFSNPQANITPYTMIFPYSTYATSGAALRNRGSAGIDVSGLPGGSHASAAFLYWAVITQGPAPLAVSSLKLSRTFPAPAASATITGVVIGTGPTPCWSGDTISIFRAGVPTSLVSGNGAYRVSIPNTPGAAGSTDGSDPWAEQILPLWEGASLAVIAPGTSTVVIYDTGLAGATINFPFGALYYTLDLPSQTFGGQVLMDNIGADGQFGVSRTPQYLVAQEQTYVNGYQIAGNFANAYQDSDSDWNGSSGFPLPQLWDNTGHDITPAAPYGTYALNVFFSIPSDCVTAVANIVQYQ